MAGEARGGDDGSFAASVSPIVWFWARDIADRSLPVTGISSQIAVPNTAMIPTAPTQMGQRRARRCGSQRASCAGLANRHFALQHAPVCRVQLKGRTCFLAAFLRGGAEQLFNCAFRFVGHNSYQLDGKAAGFPRTNTFRAISSSWSRHLLRRELTVLGLRLRERLISS